MKLVFIFLSFIVSVVERLGYCPSFFGTLVIVLSINNNGVVYTQISHTNNNNRMKLKEERSATNTDHVVINILNFVPCAYDDDVMSNRTKG